MEDKDRKIHEQLWKLFIQKITDEWDEKYKSQFGRYNGLDKINNILKFAENIKVDIQNTLKRNNINVKVLSTSRINQLLQNGKISINSKIETKSMFSWYVCNKDWDDFLEFNQQETLETESSDELIKTINIDSIDKIDEYYIYYYIDTSFKPDKGLLRIRNVNAELTFFHTDLNKQKNPNVIYVGNVNRNMIEGTLTINFTHELYQNSNRQIESLNPSFCSFDKTDGIHRIGVFAASGQTISCGIVVLEKSDSNYLSKINELSIPPLIHTIIYNARLITTGYQHKEHFLLKKENILKKAKEIAGVYEGYTIINQGELGLQKLVMEIFPNGDARFKSIGKPDGEVGRIVDVRKSRNLVLQFSLNRAHNYYKIQIVLDLQKAGLVLSGSSKTLIGIFGGIEERSESPMAGRIILYPANKSFDELIVDVIPINDEERLKNLIEEEKPMKRGLVKFFRGEMDEFVDPPVLVERSSYFSQSRTIK
jgi:hypothetical protein